MAYYKWESVTFNKTRNVTEYSYFYIYMTLLHIFQIIRNFWQGIEKLYTYTHDHIYI